MSLLRGAGRRALFIVGMLFGVLLVFLVRYAINETPLADVLVAPLLVDDTGRAADAIVVLGAGVTGACSPNQNGVWRVLHGVREWRKGLAPIVLFTGGRDESGCAIGSAMGRMAREIGMPDAGIVLETAARSTRENAVFSAPLLRGRGACHLLIVTDRLHMRRAAGAFTELGFEVARVSVPIYEGHRDNMSMLAEGAREVVALAYYRLRGWVSAVESSEARCSSAAGAAAASPAGQSGVTVGARPLSVGPPTLVVFGASYAGGWTPPPVAGLEIVNRGIAGQTSQDMLERFEREMNDLKPRAVMIWGFINDVFRAGPGDADTVLAQIRDRYTRMIASARELGIEPIVATEVTVRPRDGWREAAGAWVGWLSGKEGYVDRVNRYVVDTNRWLMNLARQERILLLDFQGALDDGSGRRRREFIADDGSHITGAGYAALTAYAAPILDAHFARHGE